jgi:hypothetical protein
MKFPEDYFSLCYAKLEMFQTLIKFMRTLFYALVLLLLIFDNFFLIHIYLIRNKK